MEFLRFLRVLRDEEDGQGLVEYALIISLVAIACIAALELVAGGVGAVLTDIGNTLNPPDTTSTT